MTLKLENPMPNMIYLYNNQHDKSTLYIISNIYFSLLQHTKDIKMVHDIDITTDIPHIVNRTSTKILPKYVILINLDPMESKNKVNFMNQINSNKQTKILKILDYLENPTHEKFFTNFCKNYDVMYYGFSTYHQPPHYPPHKTIDVLCYCNVRLRRVKLIMDLESFCESNNLIFKCYDYTLFNEYHRKTIISQSNIIVTFNGNETTEMSNPDIIRISYLTCINAFVLAESCNNIFEQKTKNYISYFNSFPQLKSLILHYIKNPSIREESISKSIQNLKNDFNFDKNVTKLLNF